MGDGEGGVGDERRRRRRVARGGAERREEEARPPALTSLARPAAAWAPMARTLAAFSLTSTSGRRRRVVVGARLGADERDGTVEKAAVVKRGAQLGIVLEVGA